MPLTPIAALLYLFFLVPGLVFVSRAETHLPRRERSVFRETARVIFASVGCAAVVLVLYIVVSIWWTLPIDGVVKFTANPMETFTARPRASIFWMMVFLGLASAVAWAAASKRIYHLGRTILWTGTGDDVQGITAWQSVLLPPSGEDVEVMVGVQLKSGIWVEGAHDAHSDVEEENGDRQIILRSPLKYRLKDDDSVEELGHFDRMVISASEIDFMATFLADQE